MNQNIFLDYDLGYLLKGSFVLESYEYYGHVNVLLTHLIWMCLENRVFKI